MTIPAGLNAACMSNRLLAYDDFSEADGTAITGKSLDIGGAWAKIRQVAGSDSTQVLSGKAVSASNGSFTMIGSNVSTDSDVRFECDLTLPNDTASEALLVLRWNGVAFASLSAGTFLQLGVEANVALRIRSVVNGAYTTILDNTTNKPLHNTTYKMVVTLVGTSITWEIVGLTTVTATVPASSNGRYGFATFKRTTNPSSAIDNFKVEAL